MARILLVDDNEDIRDMINDRLSIYDHEIEERENGKLGIEEAMKGNYDIILMDMHMPVMDGHEAVRTLRKKGYAGLIVAVTASAMNTDINQIKKDGCDDIIAKPIGPNFEDLIEQILERKSHA